jgi:hypothetical protein
VFKQSSSPLEKALNRILGEALDISLQSQTSAAKQEVDKTKGFERSTNS